MEAAMECGGGEDSSHLSAELNSAPHNADASSNRSSSVGPPGYAGETRKRHGCSKADRKLKLKVEVKLKMAHDRGLCKSVPHRSTGG